MTLPNICHRYAIILTLLLAGCTQIEKAAEGVEQANDRAAKINVKVPCATSVGAYYRVLSSIERRGTDLLCDPKPDGVTVAP